jgi:transmembrane sensor
MDKKDIYEIIRHNFDGTIPEKYMSAVGRWLLNKKQEKEKEDALYDTWKNLSADNAVPNQNTYEMLNDVRQRLGLHQTTRKDTQRNGFIYHISKSFYKYAAIAIILLTVAIGIVKVVPALYTKNAKMEICHVENGQIKKVFLADGTVIIVNSGSIIKYPEEFDSDSRDVYLQGEAAFTVKHNSEHPFVVHVGNLEIKDIGTQFNVKSYQPKEVIATLKEGSVALTEKHQISKSSPILLKPSEQVVYNEASHSFTVHKVDASKIFTWVDGGLFFEEEPLNRVLQDVERHFNIKIQAANNVPLNNLYTLQFNSNESLTSVLDILTAMGNMKYSIHGKTVILSKAP